MRSIRWASLALTVLVLTGVSVSCRKAEEAAAPAPGTPAPASPAAQATEAAQAPPDASPVGPMSSRGEMPAAPAASSGPGIDFDLPASWDKEAPESGMRLAQARIPGPGGIGQLAVFYFGPGQGGSVDANLERWSGQIGAADGAKPKRESFETKGFKVTWIDLSGTLKPSGMGMGPKTDQPNSRLLGAVIEGPGGPWFFKATGSDATLGPQRDAFVKMLHSIRPK
ncbi:MAG TPA: hypothetical protein VOA87_23030 [Thermoanaerobaculia bacterium]|nr:hypothetical protein [Thermoanaerobaculia bacterium]